MIRLLTLTSTLVFSICVSAVAQETFKAAHLNTGLILEAMPESGDADSMLRGYQDSLQQGLVAMEQQFSDRLTALRDSSDYMTPKQGQAREQELQEMQQQMQVFQQEGARMFERRRETYLGPILGRVQVAINSYAQAQDYNIIFDTSIPGALVFARDTDDITNAILGELGVTVEPQVEVKDEPVTEP